VSPSGSGQGASRSDPMSFASAIASAQAGDFYRLLGGTYSGAFNLTRSGTSANPIIWKADDGAHVIVNGGFEITGANNWIWGMEITDPGQIASSDSGVRMLAAGIRIINNVVHDQYNKNGIGAWMPARGRSSTATSFIPTVRASITPTTSTRRTTIRNTA